MHSWASREAAEMCCTMHCLDPDPFQGVERPWEDPDRFQRVQFPQEAEGSVLMTMTTDGAFMRRSSHARKLVTS